MAADREVLRDVVRGSRPRSKDDDADAFSSGFFPQSSER